MRWKKMMLGMLAISVLFSTAMLGKNLWQQEKEELKFTYLRKSVSKVQDDEPFHSEPEIIRADSTEDNENKRVILPEYQKLAEENPDFSGWISIEGTRIDYPVMQTPDDSEYYLHRNFDGEYSYAGVPFVGTGDMGGENEDIFIYGHNMRNGSMFADLLQYQKEEFWRAHPVIVLDTLWEKRNYEVFAAFYANEEEWIQEEGRIYQVLYKNGESKVNVFRTLEGEGGYKTGIILKADSHILYLVTCSYHEPGTRFVVAGVLKED